MAAGGGGGFTFLSPQSILNSGCMYKLSTKVLSGRIVCLVAFSLHFINMSAVRMLNQNLFKKVYYKQFHHSIHLPAEAKVCDHFLSALCVEI